MSPLTCRRVYISTTAVTLIGCKRPSTAKGVFFYYLNNSIRLPIRFSLPVTGDDFDYDRHLFSLIRSSTRVKTICTSLSSAAILHTWPQRAAAKHRRLKKKKTMQKNMNLDEFVETVKLYDRRSCPWRHRRAPPVDAPDHRFATPDSFVDDKRERCARARVLSI